MGAELQAVRHRYSLLQLTAAEQREALERKRADCEAWKRRAIQRGQATSAEVEAPFEKEHLRPAVPSTPPSASREPLKHDIAADLGSDQISDSISAIQTPLESTPQYVLGEQADFDVNISHIPPAPLPPPPFASGTRVGQPARHSSTPSLHRRPTNSKPKQSSWSQGIALGSGRSSTSHSGGWSRSLQEPQSVLALPPFESEPIVASPAEDFLNAALRAALLHSNADRDAIVEAENEVEMHAFLLGESDVQEAEALLEIEAQRRPPLIAYRLRAQLDELSTRHRGARSRSPGVF